MVLVVVQTAVGGTSTSNSYNFMARCNALLRRCSIIRSYCRLSSLGRFSLGLCCSLWRHVNN